MSDIINLFQALLNSHVQTVIYTLNSDMYTNISEFDPIWAVLQSEFGRDIPSAFRTTFAADAHLATIVRTNNIPGSESSWIAKRELFAQLVEWKTMQKIAPPEALGEGRRRGRKPVLGGHGTTPPNSSYYATFPSDRSGPISSMIAALALKKYEPVRRAIRLSVSARDRGSMTHDTDGVAKFLKRASTAETKWAGLEVPLLYLDQQDHDDAWMRMMDAGPEALSQSVDRYRTEAETLYDRAFVRRLRLTAHRLHLLLDKIVAESDEKTRDVLFQANRQWERESDWRTLQMNHNWFGTDATVITFGSECRFLCGLQRACFLVSANYAWVLEHALPFLFIRAAPPPTLIRIQYKMREDYPVLSRIHIEVEPGIPEDVLASVYRKAREHVLPTVKDSKAKLRRGRSKPKTLGMKHLALASHVYGRPLKESLDEPVDSLVDLMDEWNRRYGKHLTNLTRPSKSGDDQQKTRPATYEFMSKFLHDASLARKNLIFPEYKFVDSDGYFIGGDRLPALQEIGKSPS